MSRWNFCMRIVVMVGVVHLCLAGVGYTAGNDDRATSHGQSMDAAAQAMMAKWQAYASPNDNHQVLNPLVGTWSHVIKWWMTPDSQPETSQGTSETQWVMGGRFLLHKANGTSMGQPFEGMGLTGFDNGKQTYQTIWMDNMGTGMMIGEGTYDPSQKTLTDRGRFTDPTVGQRSYRGVITFMDDTHYRYEMYGADENGKEFRMLEIVYTRTD
ncbi:MAG: DUF1579 domain-containing protein [Nitrospira sp.]|nr:DUF1579 domain-containing protein [Nitrospira sp.]